MNEPAWCLFAQDGAVPVYSRGMDPRLVVIECCLKLECAFCTYYIFRQVVHSFTTCKLKKFFLRRVLALFLKSLYGFPLRCCVWANWKNWDGLTRSKLLMILKVSIRSPLRLLLFSGNRLGAYNRCSYGKFFKPTTNFVAVRWTFSRHSMSLIK